jgi:hypothetical protein
MCTTMLRQAGDTHLSRHVHVSLAHPQSSSKGVGRGAFRETNLLTRTANFPKMWVCRAGLLVPRTKI